jgi:hypothetical protein
VSENGGLIHVDSAPESGTRITTLLPSVPQTAKNCYEIGPEKHEGDSREGIKKRKGIKTP